jgi:hypothetical protein
MRIWLLMTLQGLVLFSDGLASRPAYVVCLRAAAGEQYCCIVLSSRGTMIAADDVPLTCSMSARSANMPRWATCQRAISFARGIPAPAGRAGD